MVWDELKAHRDDRVSLRIESLFVDDPERAQGFAVRAEGLLLDY